MENIWMEKVFLGRWVVPCLDFPGVFWRILWLYQGILEPKLWYSLLFQNLKKTMKLCWRFGSLFIPFSKLLMFIQEIHRKNMRNYNILIQKLTNYLFVMFLHSHILKFKNCQKLLENKIYKKYETNFTIN
jgi:hypothetical protein